MMASRAEDVLQETCPCQLSHLEDPLGFSCCSPECSQLLTTAARARIPALCTRVSWETKQLLMTVSTMLVAPTPAKRHACETFTILLQNSCTWLECQPNEKNCTTDTFVISIHVSIGVHLGYTYVHTYIFTYTCVLYLLPACPAVY